MSITDKMIYLRTHSGLSTDEISEKSGVPVGTINKIFTGETKNPTGKTASKLAKVFGVTAEYLLNDGIPIEYTNVELMGPVPSYESTRGKTQEQRTELYAWKHRGAREAIEKLDLPEEALKIAKDYAKLDERGKGAVKSLLDYEVGICKMKPAPAESVPPEAPAKPAKPAVTPLPKTRQDSHGIVEIKTYDQPAAAGLGNYLDEPDYHIEQYPDGVIPDKADFGVVISGDSMEPKIHDGSTVFVQAAPSIDPGKIGIFVLNGQAYCKKLSVDRENRQVRLVSLNPNYADIVIGEADDIRTIGRVLGQWKPGYKQDIFGW